MAINKITLQKKEEIKKKSVLALPNNASERGVRAEVIKSAMYTPVEMVMLEIDRVVDEQNIQNENNNNKLDSVANSTEPISNLKILEILNK